jgi:tyrosine phenol-lyase
VYTFQGKVYTQARCDVTVESIESVHEKRENVLGLRMVHEPTYLRYFQARFERL